MLPSEAIKFKRPLLSHQAKALDRFAYEKEAALFWEMGTGKTTAAIAWLRAKYNVAREVTKTLIITPVATLYNWQDEFKLNAPDKVVDEVLVPYMKTKSTKYTGLERANIINTTEKRILILNGEAIDNDEILTAIRNFGAAILCVDESHRFKAYARYAGNAKRRNPSRAEKLRGVAKNIENRIILTGTPILNSYLDLWSQFYILDSGKTFSDNFFLFRQTFFEDKNAGWRSKPNYFPDWRPKKECVATIQKLIEKKSSRITKEECLDLPPLLYEKHYVEMADDQRKAYNDMERDLLSSINSGVCTATNALSKVNRLLQILSGHAPVEYDLSNDKTLTYFKANPRLLYLSELLSELSKTHKVIVWATFKASYSQIRGVFKTLDIEWAEVTGETDNRQIEIERFRDNPKCRVMLANPQAGGVGINMVAASYSIYYARSYSLGDRLQSEARNHRGGSEIHDKITIIDLVAKDTLDEVVLAALLRKENFSDLILDKLKALC